VQGGGVLVSNKLNEFFEEFNKAYTKGKLETIAVAIENNLVTVAEVMKIFRLTNKELELIRNIKTSTKPMFDEKGRVIINNQCEIPQNMIEDEVHKCWKTHSMSEEFLEESYIKEDDESFPPARKFSTILQMWVDVLEKIKNKISKPSFDTWLSNTQIEKDDEVLIVKAKNEFQRDWLEERYKTLIFETVKEVAGETYEIEFISENDLLQPQEPSLSSRERLRPHDELLNLIRKQQEKIQELEKRIEILEQEGEGILERRED
jgi:hypothetical protein